MANQAGERLRFLRTKAGYSQRCVSEKLGISDTAYQNYEYGKRDIPGNILRAAAALYDASIDYLLGLVDDPHAFAGRTSGLPVNVIHATYDDSSFVDVPLYGSIAAGCPLEMQAVDDLFPVPRAIIERYGGFDEDGRPIPFLLRVVGQSMNRILPDGVLALVVPCNTIDYDNDPYAVCVNGYDATVKRVHKLNNGFELVPDSTDPTFKPQVYDYGIEGTETITPIGRVVYYVLPYDWRF